MPVVHFFLYLMSIFKAPTISNCILGIKWLMYLVVEYKLNTSGLAFVYDNAVFVAVIGESYSFLFGCWIHKYTSRTSFFVNYYTVFFIKTTLCFLSVVLKLYKENSRLLRTRVKKISIECCLFLMVIPIIYTPFFVKISAFFVKFSI